jgi:hypothetical protein
MNKHGKSWNLAYNKQATITKLRIGIVTLHNRAFGSPNNRSLITIKFHCGMETMSTLRRTGKYVNNAQQASLATK